MRHTQAWARGDTAQRRWADVLADRKNCVLPAYAFEDVVRETKAPVMVTHDGFLVTPDVLSLSHGTVLWHEVKSKSQPTWRRLAPGPRWEHGFDYSLLQEYRTVAERTGCDVWVVVHELASPADPLAESGLTGPALWLVMPLVGVLVAGEHRPDWPGGRADRQRRGRRGAGGWLWARSGMMTIQDRGPKNGP